MIDGTYNILYIDAGNGYYPVGNLVSNSFSEDIETIDSTTRDNAGWKTQTLTNQSYQLEFNGLVSGANSQDKINYASLKQIKRDKQIIDWKTEDGKSNFIEGGKAQITSLSNESNIDEFVSFSASLQGYGALNNYFIFQVTTSNAGTSNSNQFTLPLTSAFSNNITVHWGDGFNSNITSYNQSEATHTYASAGTYTIKISGSITSGWSFNNGGDCLKMGDISRWAGFSSSTTAAFKGCANLTSIADDVNFLNQATILTQYFYDCGLTSLPSTLTLASLTNGNEMIRGNQLTSLPSAMTLANLTNGDYMFGGNSLTTLPSGMILANVTNGSSMFRYNQITFLPSVMTLASLENGNWLFENNSLTDLPSGITLSNLSNATDMFKGNTLIISRYSQLLIDLENLNTNNSFSFHGGNSMYNVLGQTARNILTSAPRNITITDGGLYAFQFTVTTSTSGVTANNQFKLPLTSAFTDNINVFWGDGTSSNITTYNQAEVTHTYASAGTYSIAIANSITAGWSFNNGGDRLKIETITKWADFSSTTIGAFKGCANLTSIASDVDFLNQATNLSSYFYGCGFTSLPSTLTLASLTDGSSTFEASQLTSLPSAMTLANLTNGYSMFFGAPITSLPSAMTLESLTDGSYMFYNGSLASLPSVMTLSSLTNGTAMFYNNSLTSLPSVLTLASLTNGAQMFEGNQLTALSSVMTLASLTNGISMFENNSLIDLPSGITLSSLTNGINMFIGNTINTARYSQLLVDLENLNTNNSFSFHGGNSMYNATGQTARNILTSSPRNLTITDGGLYAFQFTVTTSNAGTSNNDEFKLPLTSAFTDNITVGWGDGTLSNITSYNQAEVTHTYASAGTYSIAISGSITAGWSFNGGGDCLKMGDITKWEEFSSTTAGAFKGCANLTSIASDVDFLNQATNLSSYFEDCRLTSLPSTLTLASLTNGTNIFKGNTINTTRYSELLVDLENLNTNNSFSFHGGNSMYNVLGQTAQNILTSSPRNLTITDNGSYAFQFQVTTSNAGTSNSNQFTLPLTSAFTDNITVYWGDGTSSNITTYNQAEITHTYASAGTYTIKIFGGITDGWQFSGAGDCLKMGNIIRWGDFTCINGAVFSGCANMTAIADDVDFLNQATYVADFFDNCSLTALPSTLTFQNLVTGWQTFRNNNLTTLPSAMTLSNLESAYVMFRTNQITSLPSGMTLPSLSNGYYMFANNSITNLPSGMTLPNLNNGYAMFHFNQLTDLPSGMTLPNLNNGYWMFDGNTINTTRYSQLLVDLENLNTNNSFTFHGGNSKYNTTGQTARNILTSSPRNLTITDGGLV